MQVIDLSHPLRSGMANNPQFPEHDVVVRPIKDIATDGIATMLFQLSDHVGTHLDAPSHIVPGGLTIEEVPLNRLSGRAVALDVRKGEDGAVTVDDLLAAEPAVRHGDIVLLETGWSDRIGTQKYTDHHPYLDPDAARWLVDSDVALVGIDVSSVDLPMSLRSKGFRHETLRILLDAGIPALHGLTNLHLIRGTYCTVSAFPIVFAGADAGPVRAVAFIND